MHEYWLCHIDLHALTGLRKSRRPCSGWLHWEMQRVASSQNGLVGTMIRNIYRRIELIGNPLFKFPRFDGICPERRLLRCAMYYFYDQVHRG